MELLFSQEQTEQTGRAKVPIIASANNIRICAAAAILLSYRRSFKIHLH